MSSLRPDPGLNIIRNAQAKDRFIGRRMVEDHSLNPKRVVVLPPGVQAPTWIVEELSNGRCILKIGGAPTGIINNHVFAFLTPEDPPEEWVITRQESAGPNAYTIERASDPGQGWLLPNEAPETPVAIRPLIAIPTEPPIFPPNVIWIIEPVSDT